MSTRDSIRGSTRLLREIKALPDDDPRLLRLTELMPAVDMLMDAIPADARISAASAEAYLDSLISYAAKAAGARRTVSPADNPGMEIPDRNRWRRPHIPLHCAA